MREEVLAGRRVLDNGTFVELQPGAAERDKGVRWFAAIRDGRVGQDGQITVEWCEENCQQLTTNSISRVYIESIIRVSAGAGRQFEDVPRVAATSAPHTPTKYQSSFSPLKVPQSNTAAATPKAPSVACAASSTGKRQRQLFTVENTSQSPLTRSPQPSAATPSQHEKEMQDIITIIGRATKNNVEALNQFRAASKKLTDAGWKRCKTVEQRVACSNIEHPDYNVVEIPRDGKCAYHCMLRILIAERCIQPPATPQDLRKDLARYVTDQEPPPGIDKGVYGGIWANEEYLLLEEPLESTYGGEAALAVFVQLYDVTIHCHAPESRNAIQTFKGHSPHAREYHMLQTYSWNSWQLVEIMDPETNVKAKTYKHYYGGDHWQLLEPKDRPQQALTKQTLHFFPQSAASAASTAPKIPGLSAAESQRKDLLPKRLTFDAKCPPQSAASAASTTTGTVPEICANKEVPSGKAGLNIDAAKPIAAETKFTEKIEVQLMLRAVRTHPYMCNAKLNAKNCDDKLELETIHSNNFFVYNFENHFDRGYPSHIRKILQAFPDLNEDNRSFFLALGIGTGMDPFLLQCLFRIEGERILRVGKTQERSIQSLVHPGLHVDSEVLKWCWPPDFDQLRVMVIDKTRNGAHWAFKSKLFQTKDATEQRKMVILMHHKDQYQLLKHCTGNETEFSQHATKVQVQITDMRCPSISTLSQFNVFQNDSLFLAAGLDGTEPPEHDLDTIWKTVVNEHGLEFDPVVYCWTDFPGWAKHLAKTEKGKDNLKDGSMVPSSWKDVRTKLLQAFETTFDIGHEDRSAMAQPQCTFVDAGSESGRGLYHMIRDKRVTHVAGVEYQFAWFQLSTKIFTSVRTEFQRRGYRMPEVTLIHSCMIAQQPVMKWLYSISSIMWMNNFVYDKYDYFTSIDPQAANYRGKALLSSKKLTANAAYNFSVNFEDITLIAVHYPEAFLERWNYTTCEEFQVSCTWSQTSTKEKVTILKHTQHLKITNDYMLPSPTRTASNTWDSWTQQWSDIASAERQTPGPSFFPNPTPSRELIHWRHFSTLTHRNWVCSQIIQTYMWMLRDRFPNITFDQLTDPGSSGEKQLKRRYRGDINVFAINLWDTHWIGAKLEKSKKRILVYDSYPGDHSEQFEQIEKIAGRIGVQGPFQRIDVKVPHQRNATDCGVTTCLFLLCMAHNIEDGFSYDSPTVMRQFRQTLFIDILNEEVTVLKPKND
jgi:hypothetical protein